ncbi:hypothetical protein D3C75_641370 [compost metagenome]
MVAPAYFFVNLLIFAPNKKEQEGIFSCLAALPDHDFSPPKTAISVPGFRQISYCCASSNALWLVPLPPG